MVGAVVLMPLMQSSIQRHTALYCQSNSKASMHKLRLDAYKACRVQRVAWRPCMQEG